MSEWYQEYLKRKSEVAKLFERFPYTKEQRAATVGAWTACDMSLDAMKTVLQEAAIDDAKVKREQEEQQQLSKGVIPK